MFWRNRPNTYIGYQKAINENFLRSESVINQYFRCNKGQPPDSNRQYGNQMIVSVRQFHTYTFNNAAKIQGITKIYTDSYEYISDRISTKQNYK